MRLPSYQELSKEQDEINDLPLDGNWLVTGPPGTGKTVMALYRTEMLDEQDRKVLVLMWSRLLKMYVQEAREELNLDENQVANFDAWFKGYWRRHFGGDPPHFPSSLFDYDWKEIHQVLNDEGIPTDTPDFIIDEGQDLPKEFYIFSRELCDHLTVFADEDQRIFETGSNVETIKLYAGIEESYELRTNYRNSRQIAEFAQDNFYDGPEDLLPDLPSRDGPEPAIKAFDTWKESADQIANHITNFSDNTVGVFLPKKSWVKKFAEYLEEKLGADRVQQYFYRYPDPFQIDFTAPGAVVTFLRNSKGLEFDTVFVCEIQRIRLEPTSPDTRNLLYVLSSRARNDLQFHYSGENKPRISSAFKDFRHG